MRKLNELSLAELLQFRSNFPGGYDPFSIPVLECSDWRISGNYYNDLLRVSVYPNRSWYKYKLVLQNQKQIRCWDVSPSDQYAMVKFLSEATAVCEEFSAIVNNNRIPVPLGKSDESDGEQWINEKKAYLRSDLEQILELLPAFVDRISEARAYCQEHGIQNKPIYFGKERLWTES